jgi:hypothetical protein
MDQKTKILWGVLLVAIIASVFITFHQTVVLKNFDVIESEAEE